MEKTVYTPRTHQVFITLLLIAALLALFIPGIVMVKRSDIPAALLYGSFPTYKTVSFHDGNATDTILPTLLTAIAMLGGIISVWRNKPERTLTFAGMYVIDEIIYIASLSKKSEFYRAFDPAAGFFVFTVLTIALVLFCFSAIKKTVEGERPSKNKVVITQTVAAPSNADEIRKYKQLLDEGLITQEEYEAKKKELL